ncbi:UNVERIFIED_ORG: hypothetical protein M2402_004349 [Rahnella aquatilis]
MKYLFFIFSMVCALNSYADNGSVECTKSNNGENCSVTPQQVIIEKSTGYFKPAPDGREKLKENKVDIKDAKSLKGSVQMNAQGAASQ